MYTAAAIISGCAEYKRMIAIYMTEYVFDFPAQINRPMLPF
jgi:hypothetical protein